MTQLVNFPVYGPPSGGNVSMSPMSGMMGDSYLVNVNGWVSLANASIYYSVYTPIDSAGLIRGAQLNSQAIAQNKNFTSKFTSTNPIQVVVSDLKGEQV